jgi:hypothetical protein
MSSKGRILPHINAILYSSDVVEDYEIQTEAEEIAFATSGSDPATLYYKEAMQANDSADFKATMLKGANNHMSREHWKVWEKQNFPDDQDMYPAVWAFKNKCRVDITQAIYIHKAQLNLHGGKQMHRVSYWGTYSPVVNWFSIHLCLTFSLIFHWHKRQINFGLAFPQADVECGLFTELFHGLSFKGVHRSTHSLKLKKNIWPKASSKSLEPVLC